MPGHISLPACQGFADQPEQAPPATLSPRLLNELLRGELGLEGLIISDASGMNGLTSRASSEERVVECIRSGIDVYLLPETREDFERLIQAVEQGRLSEDRVRQAARRVLEHLLSPEDDLLVAKAVEHDTVFVNMVALPYMVLGTIRNLTGHLGYWKWRSLHMEHPQVLFTSFGNPYVLHEMPHLPNLLAA
jgi:hypothetical protein